ncbi:MAG TPA: signal peptidase II [Solirubrobacterales bacterium]|nr:signal peptidase II [Solirubrobacterales bacterium]
MSADSSRPWRLALALCGIVVVADQAIKAVVESNLVPGEEAGVFGPLTITNVHNRGVAFGLAGGSGDGIVVLTLAALAVIVVLFARASSAAGMWVAVGLVAGGALGNLADRVRIDAVTDYIDLPAWPAFNLADIAITLGVGLFVLTLLREAEA